MPLIDRREALVTLSAAGSAVLFGNVVALSAENSSRRTSLGIVTYALGIHQKNQWGGRHEGLSPALALLEESHQLGAAGIQVDLGPKDAPHAAELRRRAEQYGMYVEGSIMPPRTSEDAARFEEDVRLAKTAGAVLARTVIMPGRRYEQFKSLEEFRHHEKLGLESLQRAEAVLARQRFRLAVENHKDQRVPEKLDLIKRLGSEFIGICVDVGNSFTLLEDPLETARAFAPYAMTVHFKDQAVRENQDGFWYADMALGEGFLPLKELIKVLRAAKTDIPFNLETITRDPLNVPILKDEYWATMPDRPARDLARTLHMIKAKSVAQPFVQVSQLPAREQMALELRNVEQSITYARERLGFVL